MFSYKQPSVHKTVSETQIQNNELISIWLIKRVAMEVVSKDPNIISTVDKCDTEDQCTVQDALNDTEDHKIEIM